ncbi:flagellar basal-body MS-ring/collar protein FliF [Microbulbifer epialgicus]|uniref:Flagellar M-ring protein n=1 Tax=Microbulbifer epialgicus TaxID=393907 RepID=A0ABV4NYF8_9GAMM
MHIDFKSYQKKIFAGLFVLSSILAVVLFLLIKTGSEILVSDLQKGEISSVTRTLVDNNVSFEIDEQNGAISVSSEQIPVARMLLAENGLLDIENVGFEIFDDASYGLTEFSQKIYYQRALQGEIEKSIKTLDVVRSVRVHLVLPDNSLFKRSQEEAKASVVLTVKNQYALRQDKIVGIQNLVAASVPKLMPSKVTIMDSKGNLLSSSELLLGDALQKVEFKRELEEYYTAKVNEILFKVIDQKNAVVSVDLTIDYSKSESTQQNSLPLVNSDSGVLVSNKVSREYREDSTSKRSSSKGKSSENDILSESIENNYQYSSELVKKQVSPGRIIRKGVSILLTSELGEGQLQKLRDLVANAVGLNEEAGDKISIEFISLEKTIKSDLASNATQEMVGEKLKEPVKVLLRDSSLQKYDINKFSSIKIYVYAGISFFILIILFFIFGRGRLNSTERLEVLDDMRIWLNESSSSRQADVK